MRGTQLKIGNDIEYANYLEHKICVEKNSPEAVLEELKILSRERKGARNVTKFVRKIAKIRKIKIF